MAMHQRVQHVYQVAAVIENPPHDGNAMIYLPEDRPSHDEDDIVHDSQRDDGQPLCREREKERDVLNPSITRNLELIELTL